MHCVVLMAPPGNENVRKPDGAGLLVADVGPGSAAPGCVRRDRVRRQRRQPVAERQDGGELERGRAVPAARRARSSGIHTAPSTVARQTAPARVASSSPGRPRSRSSGCPPCRNHSPPSSSSSTPGCESAARSLRSTVSVGSDAPVDPPDAPDGGTAGCRPWHVRRSWGRGVYVPEANRSTASSTAVQRRVGRPRCGTGRSCRPAARRSPPTPRRLRRPSPRRPAEPLRPNGSTPSWIAQSSEDGPRSPTGPGWTIRQVCADHTSAGMAVLSIGATIRSGASRRTASAQTDRRQSASPTATVWPRSRSSAWTR